MVSKQKNFFILSLLITLVPTFLPSCTCSQYDGGWVGIEEKSEIRIEAHTSASGPDNSSCTTTLDGATITLPDETKYSSYFIQACDEDQTDALSDPIFRQGFSDEDAVTIGSLMLDSSLNEVTTVTVQFDPNSLHEEASGLSATLVLKTYSDCTVLDKRDIVVRVDPVKRFPMGD